MVCDEVARGEVTIEIGLTEGSDLFFETVIGRGIHSLSFVPDDGFGSSYQVT